MTPVNSNTAPSLEITPVGGFDKAVLPIRANFLDLDDNLVGTEVIANIDACKKINGLLASHGIASKYQFETAEYLKLNKGRNLMVVAQEQAALHGFTISEKEANDMVTNHLFDTLEAFEKAQIRPPDALIYALEKHIEMGRQNWIISNSATERIGPTLRISGLDRYIESDKVVSCQSDYSPARLKPDEYAIRDTLGKTGFKGDEVLYVDDSPHGIKAAKNVVQVAAYVGFKVNGERIAAIQKLRGEGCEIFFDDWKDHPRIIEMLENKDVDNAKLLFSANRAISRS